MRATRNARITSVITFCTACSVLILLSVTKLITGDFRAHTEVLNTNTISIVVGERHTCQITDKISGTQWTFKTVLRRKGDSTASKPTKTGNENIAVSGNGRYIVVDDITSGKRYKIRM